RKVEQCLVHQVLEHVVAADVDDECELWVQRCDVGKVLLRPYADVNAVSVDFLFQGRNHELQGIFVRHVLQLEPAASFGKARPDLPKLRVAEPPWKIRGARRPWQWGQKRANGQ